MSTRDFAAFVLEKSGLGWLMRLCKAWPGLVVLAYHRIGDGASSPFDRGLWSATPEAFSAQVAFLKRHFDVIGPRDLALIQGKSHGRYALITFDDGYRDNYALAFPILRAHGVGAIFFLSTGFLDHPRPSWWDEIAWMVRISSRGRIESNRWLPTAVTLDKHDQEPAIYSLLRTYKSLPGDATEDYLDFLGEATGSGRCPRSSGSDTWMTWEMVREMRSAGMWFGGHTVHHPILAQLPREQQQREISGCGRRLAEELGEPMTIFSYPVGGPQAFNADTRSCLVDQGVKFAFSYYGGYQKLVGWDPYNLRRLPVEGDINRNLFRATATFPRIFA